MSASIEQRNQDSTCWIGNLDERVTEDILWELMNQCGPVVGVHMPRDKISGKHLGYGFVEFKHEEDTEYAIKVMNMVKLYTRPMKMNSASQDKKFNDIGANIFIGNMAEEVDEKLLYDTFSAFGGMLTTPKVMRDPETGISKGYGFISYDSFESSDMAIECMNGQYLCNRPIVISYAYKKDTPGERHGSQAERLIAAANPVKFKPNTLFSAGRGDSIVQISAPTASPLTSNTFALTGAFNSQSLMPPVLQNYSANSQSSNTYQQQQAQMGYPPNYGAYSAASQHLISQPAHSSYPMYHPPLPSYPPLPTTNNLHAPPPLPNYQSFPQTAPLPPLPPPPPPY